MPSASLAVPPLLLAAVLVVSGVAKVRDPRDTASVFRQLGVPGFVLRLRGPRLLPYGELLLAVALVLTSGWWYAAAASVTLVLFALYVVVIGRALRLPFPVTCPCFGRLGLGEVTGRTLARNLVLLAVAVVTWVDSWRGDGVLSRLERLDARAWWLVAVIALVLVVVVAVLVRRRARPEPDALGYRARPTPEGVLYAASGPVPVWELTDSAARLLVFCDPELDAEIVAQLRVWSAQVAPVLVHLVTESAGALQADFLQDPSGAYRQAVGVASPGAVLLGTDRMLAGGPVTGPEEIAGLVDAMAAELAADPR
ncbi:MAG: MauE/DoxX family redox-associated membrane protein [Nocardioides sp.]